LILSKFINPAKKIFKEIANGAKIQVLPIIPIYAKVSKRRKIKSILSGFVVADINDDIQRKQAQDRRELELNTLYYSSILHTNL
jgi:hypothetical protein